MLDPLGSSSFSSFAVCCTVMLYNKCCVARVHVHDWLCDALYIHVESMSSVM